MQASQDFHRRQLKFECNESHWTSRFNRHMQDDSQQRITTL
ncbi:hypothetical protein PAMC26577_21415 [Caballeronia sordidicola]|uniref:Uncharacterized protein n=1 Tax=Caballeronia sordidicola TaxID=196367 RepID=A0A242MMA5_CABSO|nr:hypothetical protein PAMC26577_21415 [Caballeronia sordidicola]